MTTGASVAQNGDSSVIRLHFVLHPHQWGWRWAIHLNQPPSTEDPSIPSCLNAGIEATEQEADERGQVAVYTLMHFCRRIRTPNEVQAHRFEVDIIPAGSVVQISDTKAGAQAVIAGGGGAGSYHAVSPPGGTGGGGEVQVFTSAGKWTRPGEVA